MSTNLQPSIPFPHKKIILILRTLLILTAWALFSYQPEAAAKLYGHVLFLLFGASSLGLLLIKEEHFQRTRFTVGLILSDTLLASFLLYTSGTSNYGVLILFFFMILLAAVGQSLKATMVAGILACVGYALFRIQFTSLDSFLSRPDLLLAMPLLLIASLFYGYTVDENKNLHEVILNYSKQLEHYGAKIQKTYWETLKSLINALDLRDTATRYHSQRVTAYTLTLCRVLDVPESEWLEIERGVLLHDIGKIGISDSILLKGGPLSEEEWSIMKGHPMLGYQMVQGIPFLEGAADIILFHHEHYDGTGYPFGLRGEGIPFKARIFAVADAIDAMASGRPYKKKKSLLEAGKVLLSNCGKQFDPKVVQAYFHIPQDQWETLRRTLESEVTPPAPAASSQQTIAAKMTGSADKDPNDEASRLRPLVPSGSNISRLPGIDSLDKFERDNPKEPEPERILVVDDDPMVCEFLKDVLQQKGYSVDSAHSAAEAMRKLIAHQYTVAILDYMMPGADGRFLYKHLRTMKPDLANRVLLITAAPPEDHLMNFLAKNKLPFLRKPFEPEELVYAVRTLHQPSA